MRSASISKGRRKFGLTVQIPLITPPLIPPSQRQANLLQSSCLADRGRHEVAQAAVRDPTASVAGGDHHRVIAGFVHDLQHQFRRQIAQKELQEPKSQRSVRRVGLESCGALLRSRGKGALLSVFAAAPGALVPTPRTPHRQTGPA